MKMSSREIGKFVNNNIEIIKECILNGEIVSHVSNGESWTDWIINNVDWKSVTEIYSKVYGDDIYFYVDIYHDKPEKDEIGYRNGFKYNTSRTVSMKAVKKRIRCAKLKKIKLVSNET